MRAKSMKKMELVLLRSDIDEALRVISEQHCFQIIYPDGAAAAGGKTAANPDPALARRLDDALARLEKAGSYLGIRSQAADLASAHLPDDALFAEIDRISGFCLEGEAVKKRLEERGAELQDSIREARAFESLSLPFEDIGKLAFVTVRIGQVNPAALPALEKALEGRALVLSADDRGSIVAAASRKGRFALDTELGRAGFVKRDLPSDLRGVPVDALNALDRAYESNRRELAELEENRKSMAKEASAAWPGMLSSLRLAKALKKVKGKLESTEWVYRLMGWVPSSEVKRLVSALEGSLGERVAIRVYDAVPGEGEGGESAGDVPVLLKHNAFVSAFQSIVLSYGTPLYGDIDPTPFVAFFFTLLFSIMFGDVGQGAVILAAGLLMMKSAKPLFRKYRTMGPAFVAAGAGSIFMGLLVGSCFADDMMLVPAERFLTGLLLGHPKDRFIGIMPQDSLKSMFYFFGFTIGIGVLVNSTGLVINIINHLRRGQAGEAIFSKNGLAGAVFFWWVVGIAVRLVFGGSLGWWDIPGLGLPLLAILLAEPLSALVDSRGGKEGSHEKIPVVDALVGGVVEIIDTISGFASNTMSFLRVAAFALAHGVLSLVVFTMAEMVGQSAPAGIAFKLLVYVTGNIVIIALEGLIVVIQVIRLQYYEFFSKFFTSQGKAFTPMKLDA